MYCWECAKVSCRSRPRIWKWNWSPATEVAVQDSGDITVPGRKFLDILRALPEKVSVSLSVEGEKVVIKAGRSRFSLSTLPAADFPVIDDINAQQTRADCRARNCCGCWRKRISRWRSKTFVTT